MDTILVPTDFSPAANNAVEYAVELAKYFNARIILVHAFSFPIASYEAGVSLQTHFLLRETAEDNLKITRREIYMKYQFDYDVEYVAEMGPPLDIIKIVSEREHADLIVMGVVGHAGKLKEHLIGSTVLDVARKIETPTFIIPEGIKYSRIHKISFACDLRATEETDLVYIAKYFSNIFNAELEVVNVEGVTEEISLEKAETSAFIEKKLENTYHKTVHITGNDVGHELEDYFASHRTDVIMLNPKTHNLLYYLFNKSTTKELVFHAGLPILSIH
jgi:nucleotide-binding universal stress UspA family protein